MPSTFLIELSPLCLLWPIPSLPQPRTSPLYLRCHYRIFFCCGSRPPMEHLNKSKIYIYFSSGMWRYVTVTSDSASVVHLFKCVYGRMLRSSVCTSLKHLTCFLFRLCIDHLALSKGPQSTVIPVGQKSNFSPSPSVIYTVWIRMH